MSKFIINGNKPLEGEIRVAGSKNAVLPLIAATLLTGEECVLNNVPNINDVDVMIEIIKDLGVKVSYKDKQIRINAAGLSKHNPKPELASKLRASVLLLGALIGRLRKVSFPPPGGDRIGLRSIDAHLHGLSDLGVKIAHSEFIEAEAPRLIGHKIVLEETSVTATENLLLAAVTAEGKTVIKLAAMEPHVNQLTEFLNLMGAKISGGGTPTLVIEGVKSLHGAEITVIPDSNEAASLITLAAAAKGDVKVMQLNPDFLDDYLLKLKQMKVNFEVGEDFVHVMPPTESYQATKIQCGLYPKLPSDDIPTLAVLATQAEGETSIYEWLYENRLGYVTGLNKMGAKAEILDPHRIKITGPTPLKGDMMAINDIRMGMTLVVAALIAEGQSVITDIYHIDRGYENLDARLNNLGADVSRIN